MNYHFMRGNEDENKLREFMKDDNSDDERSSCCIFTDPPFGIRTELITQTIKSISSLYASINNTKLLPVFMIFPYFNEQHVRNEMPEMEMLDFQVTYMNHNAFSLNYNGRKEGSPVRIFTNIDSKLIKYPADYTNYRYCKACQRHVAKNNLHCAICNCCPSKNGSTYRHCEMCIKCVKPNYFHCSACGRCALKLNHDCKVFQQHQFCWMCEAKGHVELNCNFFKKFRNKKMNGKCKICSKAHNLMNCTLKWKFINKI
jgi:hypothetical protein